MKISKKKIPPKILPTIAEEYDEEEGLGHTPNPNPNPNPNQDHWVNPELGRCLNTIDISNCINVAYLLVMGGLTLAGNDDDSKWFFSTIVFTTQAIICFFKDKVPSEEKKMVVYSLLSCCASVGTCLSHIEDNNYLGR